MRKIRIRQLKDEAMHLGATTARKIGLPFHFYSPDRLFWKGLLLID